MHWVVGVTSSKRYFLEQEALKGHGNSQSFVCPGFALSKLLSFLKVEIHPHSVETLKL